MDLIKDIWTDADILDLERYLENIAGERIDWTKRIYSTKKKCLAIKIPILRKITKEMLKGDYSSFLDCYFNKIIKNKDILINISIELNLIVGILIGNFKELKIQKQYLINYCKISDSWVETDIIKLKINKKNEVEYFNFAINLLKSKFTFARRLGIIILFLFIKDDYAQKIFDELNKLKNEQEYYVNMAISWLLCEFFIKLKEKTLFFLKNNNLSDFVINKFISKCNDSYRVSREDKKFLQKHRK